LTSLPSCCLVIKPIGYVLDSANLFQKSLLQGVLNHCRADKVLDRPACLSFNVIQERQHEPSLCRSGPVHQCYERACCFRPASFFVYVRGQRLTPAEPILGLQQQRSLFHFAHRNSLSQGNHRISSSYLLRTEIAIPIAAMTVC